MGCQLIFCEFQLLSKLSNTRGTHARETDWLVMNSKEKLFLISKNAGNWYNDSRRKLNEELNRTIQSELLEVSPEFKINV